MVLQKKNFKKKWRWYATAFHPRKEKTKWSKDGGHSTSQNTFFSTQKTPFLVKGTIQAPTWCHSSGASTFKISHEKNLTVTLKDPEFRVVHINYRSVIHLQIDKMFFLQISSTPKIKPPLLITVLITGYFKVDSAAPLLGIRRIWVFFVLQNPVLAQLLQYIYPSHDPSQWWKVKISTRPWTLADRKDSHLT